MSLGAGPGSKKTLSTPDSDIRSHIEGQNHIHLASYEWMEDGGLKVAQHVERVWRV